MNAKDFIYAKLGSIKKDVAELEGVEGISSSLYDFLISILNAQEASFLMALRMQEANEYMEDVANSVIINNDLIKDLERQVFSLKTINYED